MEKKKNQYSCSISVECGPSNECLCFFMMGSLC
uniref:Uncharacterized protein n=1 Tax=Rhizophora mucronata TaxID=61149 RepID=A0A2P2NID8_RHIMU